MGDYQVAIQKHSFPLNSLKSTCLQRILYVYVCVKFTLPCVIDILVSRIYSWNVLCVNVNSRVFHLLVCSVIYLKINIFKCNKFNILSYVFCFSSFFNGSAFSLYCVVITSLSLGREIRTPDSTPLLPLSFFHFTKTYSEHLHHSSEATVLSAGGTAATNTCHTTAIWGLQSTSWRVYLPQQYKRELKLEFQSWKVSLRAFHSSPF